MTSKTNKKYIPVSMTICNNQNNTILNVSLNDRRYREVHINMQIKFLKTVLNNGVSIYRETNRLNLND